MITATSNSSVPASRRRSAPLAAWRLVATPMGPFVVAVDELGRLTTGWQREGWPAADRRAVRARSKDDLVESVTRRLERRFSGEPADFDDLPIPDGTPFQQACWSACRAVPRGSTISYAELARRAESPEASRAAGQCMRVNPLPVIIPCHRILASSGALHGFAGATDRRGRELAIKEWLLRSEGGLREGRGARAADRAT
jgi:methylated-DNA-[protein]-cysteine S-methyltransferase